MGVLFLDQLLKGVFLTREDFQKNYRALFGWSPEPALAFLALLLLGGLVFFLRLRKEPGRYDLACALMFAGIASNLSDRIRWGFIVDYLHLSSFFIFNLADLALLLGAGIFIWKIFRE